jgi:putative PIN family toxin of toxin-antitoxin system
MNKPRVLVDTNVLLSGLIWNGNESRLLEMSIAGEICLLIPEFVLAEARKVLERKFPSHVGVLESVLDLLDHEILTRPAEKHLVDARQRLRDPNDAEILASIVESRPDYAASGDKDLLTPEIHAVFPITRCREVLRELAEKRS